MNIIGLKEFRENTKKYITSIKKGNSFTVVRRSVPVFSVHPPQKKEVDGKGDIAELSQNIINRYKKDLERLHDA